MSAALAAVTDPEGTELSSEQRWRAGLMLWTGLHGLVSLYNDHGALPWPPLDKLLAMILSVHTRLPAAEITMVLSDQASAGSPTPDRGGR